MEDVHCQLNSLGMKIPESGRLHGMPATDISSYLAKRAGGELDFTQPIVQVKPALIWQSLALDLLLANGINKFWGWADPQAIYLLDYWLAVDPEFCFVLVYDKPENALVREFAGQFLNEEKLLQFFSGWFNYNEALLGLYSRHPERCLLVHSAAVHSNRQVFIDALDSRLRIEIKASDLEIEGGKVDAQLQRSAEIIVEAGEWNHGYEDLQSMADLPQYAEHTINPLSFWNNHIESQRNLDSATKKHKILCEDLKQRELHIKEQSDREKITEEHLKRCQDEAGLFLLNVHKMQEELQKKHDQNVGLQNKTIEIQKNLEISEDQSKKIKNQLLASKKNLTARDEEVDILRKKNVVLLENNEALKSVNEQFLLNLHQIQEAFESFYAENKILKLEITARNAAEAAENEKFALAKIEALKQYGAADRVKSQLSYRLGSVLVQQTNSVTGVLTLPVSIWKQVCEFNHDKKLNANLKRLPIERYADAHEAEEIRQHLSYRLGKTLLENYKSPVGWVKLPFIARKEIRKFRSQSAK